VSNQALTFDAQVDAVGAADANSFLGVNSSTALQISGPKGTAFVRQTTAADDQASAVEGAMSAIAMSKAINESTSLTGVSATATAATYSTGGSFANDINIDGTTNVLVINGQNVVVNLNGGGAAADRQLLIGAINSQVSGVTAAAGAGTAITLTAADGRNISVKASGTGANTVGGEVFGFTTAVATEQTVARGGVNLMAGGDITSVFSAPNSVTGEGTTTASSTTLASLSVSSVANSNLALLVSDSILDAISTARGNLGALQNRLQSTVSNLSVVSEKVSDAKSRILDADFAAETAALTKGQILQQAGLAVLAQANQSPGAVLALLKQ
jgi:flagellin